MKYRSALILGLVLLTLLVSGCEKLVREPAVLWTSEEEFTAYAELFNTVQSEYRIAVVYRENPARALRNAANPPDLVIGSHLNDRGTIALFQSLAKLMENQNPDPDGFYPGILRLGLFEEKQTLLPVSFTLPILIYPREFDTIENFALSLDEIRSLAADFNTADDQSRMAFSPRWDSSGAYSILRLFGTRFGETQTGTLSWNREALEEGIEYIRGWIEEVNGGWENETEFIEKYLYEPPYKLVDSGRILFAYSRIDDFFRIPSIHREQLDFRWISHQEKIPVGEEILFAGIPKGAARTKTARAFLSWFFDPETQAVLLERSQYKRMRHFGLAGGFSSLGLVNEIDLPRFFPELVGHIPPAEFLEYPEPLPDNWNRLKNETILPWISGKLSPEPADQELERSIERWLNQQP